MEKREEQQRESQSRPVLDDRYGKIGISAVAAAVRHGPAKAQQQQQQSAPPRGKRLVPFDRD